MISRRPSGRTSFVSFSVHAAATVELSLITSSIIVTRARACSWSIVRASILVDARMRMPNCGYSYRQTELRASVTLSDLPCRNHLAINCSYTTDESVAIGGLILSSYRLSNQNKLSFYLGRCRTQTNVSRLFPMPVGRQMLLIFTTFLMTHT